MPEKPRQPGPDGGGIVEEWVEGLPTTDDDLIPLSQTLITPELASAFGVTPEPNRTILDVHRASQETVSSILRHPPGETSSAPDAFKRLVDNGSGTDVAVDDGEEEKDGALGFGDGTSSGKKGGAKKARLVWTPQLHKRFVDVVAHLGIDNSVPKTIMNLMNVEGLTRENVASHLQKYRLYLKRMQGVASEEDCAVQASSSSGRMLASTSVSHSFREARSPTTQGTPMPPPPVIGVPPPHLNGGRFRLTPASRHTYAVLGQLPGGGSSSGSVFSSPNGTHTDR